MEDKYSQSTRLREEIEDPFAKVRSFVWPTGFAAAGIATYFAGTSLLAEAAGLRPAAPDSLINLGVDLAALVGIGTFWRRDEVSREKRLKRIQSGASIAALRVQMLATGTAAKLADLRTSGANGDGKRVVVVAAEAPALGASLGAARRASSALVASDLLVVPLLLSADGKGSVALPPPELVSDGADGAGAAIEHVALPQALPQWESVLESELETAKGQDAAVSARGLTLILKKNGRVGTRRLGTPDWDGLTADVAARATAGLDTRNI